MPSIVKTHDVFVSHSASDVAVATQIAETCRANGLDTIAQTEIPLGEKFSDALWDALAESRALLFIISDTEPTPSMAVELGAARAWNKPIFGLLTDTTAMRLPSGFRDIPLYPINRIDEVIRAIKLTTEELSDADRITLAQIHAELDVSVDHLAIDSKSLQSLVRRFRESTGKLVPGEHLLSELLRLRKQGKLRRRTA
jgi:hypothetical protein